MNFEVSNVELRLARYQSCIKAYRGGKMESRARKTTTRARGRSSEQKKPQSQGNSRRCFPPSYFSVQSFLVLFCLTASLLILPLVLPPLPPPPFLLLLLPICILLVLMVLAFMPSDVRNIASSYL